QEALAKLPSFVYELLLDPREGSPWQRGAARRWHRRGERLHPVQTREQRVRFLHEEVAGRGDGAHEHTPARSMVLARRTQRPVRGLPSGAAPAAVSALCRPGACWRAAWTTAARTLRCGLWGVCDAF